MQPENETPAEPIQAQSQKDQPLNQATTPETHKSSKAPWAVAAVASVVAIAGIAFGIYGMMKPTEAPATDNLKVQIKNTDGTTTTLETDKIEKTDKGTTVTVVDSLPNNSNSINSEFKINEMGLSIKNLEDAGTITSYTYQKDGHAPDRPLASLEILSYKSTPDVATDFIDGISGAIIYEYNPEYFFDPATECDVTLGTIGESSTSFCIKRRPAEGAVLENDAKGAWQTWSESNIDALMEVLSKKENYSYEG